MASTPAPEPVAESQQRSDSQHHGHRRRRHHKRPWYVALHPYKRQLNNLFVFCAVLLLSYLLWSFLAGR